MMKFLGACCLVCFVCGAHAAFVGRTDIPLMEGMIINEADGYSFDTPAGQLAGFSAEIAKTPKEVQEFYRDSLMELGWQKKSETRYVREQDELILQVKPYKKGSEIKMQYTFPNEGNSVSSREEGRVTDKFVKKGKNSKK